MKRYIVDRANRAILREMAAKCVWLEIGGKGTGWRGQYNPNGYTSQREQNEQGQGRTVWAGMPEFAQGFGMDRAAIQRTVLKAICGRPLGRKQYALIQSMIRELDETYGTVNGNCPF